MVNKCAVECHSNYHGKTTVPAIFSTKHEDLKSKRKRFVKDRQRSLTLFAVYITYATLKKVFKKIAKE